MDMRPVRDAYSSLSSQYIALVDDDRQSPDQDRSLIRRHLAHLRGAVLDLGCGPAYRWPIDVFARHLADAGFTEVERLQRQVAERPDRKYAAIAARAS